MDTSQLEIWRGEFGNDYFERSRVDIALRADAFSTILQGLHLSSVLEVGCGLGQNLQALVRSGLVQSVKGVEPSLYARELPHPGLVIVNGSCFSIPFADKTFDLVFTCGVLMHVAQYDLFRALAEISRVSNKYLLAIEYHSLEEEVIEWHGQKDLLWKRDYEKLMPGKLLRQGFLSRDRGFDSCHWWLTEKS